ncbi:uncharacterized protein Z518_10311 [Rhinocladiella mackenziei CBS 650.93]|uniref:Uncharacterized protein n=1 Tax=Rhinocladiella mackenziei CBS 650.93 TaxID=1442369 RepID=A0A0D2I318_9EURO|nr:uncharacterized protein Z518_10311 [Rhinocladiella mackenziei CBS 650.93]KIX00174.1 hypothetical protein Z518_10311 [Rhinocladiella mackenziei CBS 650.93]
MNQSRSNYEQWVLACKEELQSEGVIDGLTQEAPIDPDSISDNDELDSHVKAWLLDYEEEPQGGFSGQRIVANRNKWKAAARIKYKEWARLNNKALVIIYHLCDKVPQMIIAEEVTAKSAWARLSEAYKSQGFPAVYKQVSLTHTVTYRDCNTLKEYVNKIKLNRANLDALGHRWNDDVWSAVLIKGLGDSFEILTSSLLSADKGTRSFDDVIQLILDEELQKKNITTTGSIFKSHGGKGNNNGNGNNYSSKSVDPSKDKSNKKWACRTHETNSHTWKDCRQNPKNQNKFKDCQR